MTRTLWVIFILSCGQFPLQAQYQKIIDSLYQVLETDISDPARVDTYNQLAYYQDYDSAAVFDHTQKALSIATRIKYPKGIAEAYGNQAWTMTDIGDFRLAQDLWEKSLDVAIQADYPKGQASAYNGIGNIKERQGDYTQALQNHLKSLEILEKMDYRPGMAASYSNIGIIYHLLDENDKALTFYEKALQIDEELNNTYGMAYSYNNIGNLHRIWGEFEQALDFYFKSLEIKYTVGNKRDIASSYNNIGAVYREMGNYQLAINYNQKSIRLYEEIGVKNKLSYPLIDLGKTYAATQDFSKAIDLIQDGLAIAQEIGELDNVADATKTLAGLYAQLNDFPQAYAYQSLNERLEDSLNNQTITNQIARLEADFKFKQERDSIQFANNTQRLLLEKDIEDRKTKQLVTLISLLVILLFTVVLSWSLRSQHRANKLLKQKTADLKAAKSEIEKQNNELRELNTIKDKIFSIVAHDLRSPITGLQNLLTLHKYDKSLSEKQLKEYFDRLSDNVVGISDLLKNLLYWAQSQLKGELGNALEKTEVEPFIYETTQLLKETANTKKIQFNVAIEDPGSKVIVDPEVLRFLLRNLLTNALKYSHPEGRIAIKVATQDKKVSVSIIDEGMGMTEEIRTSLFTQMVDSQAGTSEERGTGLGLMLCQELIEKSSGTIGVQSEPGKGSTFWFVLPQAHQKMPEPMPM